MSVKKEKDSMFSIGIVGAGPAGSLTAYLLSLHGYKVTLFEKQIHLKRKVCGEYLCPKGVELLRQLKILDRLTLNFKNLDGMVISAPNGTIVNTTFPNHEYGLSLNRQIFDQALLNLAIDSGVLFHPDWILSSANQNSDGAWEIRNIKGEAHTFDLLIAADGRQSKIGHYLGHIKELNTKRAAIHCFLPRKKYFGLRKGEMLLLKDGAYCGLDPINDDEVNFSIVIDSEKLKEEEPEKIIKNLILSSTRLSDQFDVNDLESIEIRKVTCLKNYNHFVSGSNLAYVGDAAGFIDPLTGEGIYNALLSSQLIVKSIVEERNVEKALLKYKSQKKKLRRNKELMNIFFQWLIKHPVLVNSIATFLNKKKKRGDTFIGIVGNIYNPIEGLLKLILS